MGAMGGGGRCEGVVDGSGEGARLGVERRGRRCGWMEGGVDGVDIGEGGWMEDVERVDGGVDGSRLCGLCGRGCGWKMDGSEAGCGRDVGPGLGAGLRDPKNAYIYIYSQLPTVRIFFPRKTVYGFILTAGSWYSNCCLV